MTKEEKRILVAIDFSPGSERALATAADLAKQLAAAVDVVHIFAPLTFVVADAPHIYIDMLGRLDEERLRQRNLCVKLCERVMATRVRYTVHVFDGMPLDGLMAAIHTLKPELVVVGSHGRGAIMRTLLGSVSAALCRRSPVPVVVVPPAKQVAAAERAMGTTVAR